MKKVNLFLVSLVILVTLSVGFSSCGGGSSSNGGGSGRVKDAFQIVSEGYEGTSYFVKLKNVSGQTLNGYVKVKIKLNDGTSSTDVLDFIDMEPGDIQKQMLLCPGAMKDEAGIASWSFVEE